MAATSTESLGSTCMAVATVAGKKLSAHHLGDCVAMIVRHSSTLGARRAAFRTVGHRAQMLDAHGNSVIGFGQRRGR
eukprot:9474167-Pyramimonas_sp.AAC.2